MWNPGIEPAHHISLIRVCLFEYVLDTRPIAKKKLCDLDLIGSLCKTIVRCQCVVIKLFSISDYVICWISSLHGPYRLSNLLSSFPLLYIYHIAITIHQLF